MDPDFHGILSGAGMGDGTMSVLAEECVLVFLCLREEHFEKLLPKLTVGDHACLLQLWETKVQVLPLVRRTR